MNTIKYLVFDCMETLVDIEGFKEPKDYAYHTFIASWVESHWPSFDYFYQEYLRIRSMLAEQLPENKEYDFLTLFRLICESNNDIERNKVEQVADQLSNNYWKNYTARCSVANHVEEILNLLNKTYILGVVSNFKVEGGIEALLKSNNIDHYFDFIINSTSIGWKKPDKRIYEAVLDKTNSLPEQHLFIGDDYENDFQQPMRMGMQTLLLDRNNRYPNIQNRINSLSELPWHI